MKIAILTSKNQWFIPYAKELQQQLNAELYLDHNSLNKSYDILFILSYHHIIPKKYLQKNKHNIVIHASALPQGKGWSPMFWQILEGKNDIPFSMFEATNGIDNGDIYMQKTLHLNGCELNSELRYKQAKFILKMCIEFVKNYSLYKVPIKQNGKESFYPKRTPKDSELDISKTIDEQFNLLRIVSNNEYPAFFYKNGKKYILHIIEEKNED